MKKEKIFIDTDIFLDTILKRKPHFEFSNKLIGLCEQGEVDGFTSSLVIANIYYIVNRLTNHEKALRSISKIRSIIRVLPFTDKEIGESINGGFKDFEDSVQYFISVNNQIPRLVTRNIKDFKKANISVLSPHDYLQSLSVKESNGT
jgi:predicted nucleic acid-binding protein